MPEALKDGTVTEAAVTRAAGRVLYEIVHFGYLDGQSKHDVTTQAIEANAKIIEKTGEDAAVLLKNDGNVLPLKHDDLDSVVLIGPTAGQVDSIGINGERSVGLPERQVGPLAAMKKISGNSDIGFAVARRHDRHRHSRQRTEPRRPTRPRARHRSTSGLRQRSHADRRRNSTSPPKAAMPFRPTPSSPGKARSLRRTPATTGSICRPWAPTRASRSTASASPQPAHSRAASTATSCRPTRTTSFPPPTVSTTFAAPSNSPPALTPSRSRPVPTPPKLPCRFASTGTPPNSAQADHEQAIAAAKNAKVAVVFLWTRLQPVFGLPGDQDKLVEEIAAVNPNTIVVLNTSQPVALPWVDKVKGVLEMWWPGDEGGWSTANLLLGKVSPAGRLPVTWGKSLDDYPATDPKHPERSKERRRPQDHLQRRRQRRLPLVRQGKHRAALRLRSRPQLHHVRLLRPQRRQDPLTAVSTST